MTDALRNRALRLLARRDHTHAELAHKLAAHGTTQEIEAVLEQLERTGLLSDARFAAGFVRTRAQRFGRLKLRVALRALGVADALVEDALAQSAGDEAARARSVWSRKFGTAPCGAVEYARQARFLQGRGFPSDVIRRVLKDPEE